MEMTFKGLNYRSSLVYQGLTYIKLLSDYNIRFKIARKFLQENQSVLDVCAGDGRLEKFLPKGCQYCAVDASQAFQKKLSQKGVKILTCNLNENLNFCHSRYNIVVMIISLCHFTQKKSYQLLEKFKSVGQQVLIIEEVLDPSVDNKRIERIVMNYLCQTQYTDYLKLLTEDEFKQILNRNQYTFQKYNYRYCIGTYGF